MNIENKFFKNEKTISWKIKMYEDYLLILFYRGHSLYHWKLDYWQCISIEDIKGN